MPSHFFAKKPKDAFESSIEFKQVRSLLSKLDKKDKELQYAAKIEGTASIAYAKHQAVHGTLEKINLAVKNFNATFKGQKEALQYYDLVITLKEIVDESLKLFSKSITSQRSKIKSNLDDTFAITGAVTGVACAIAGSFTSLGILAAGLAGSFSSNIVSETLGLKNNRAKSYELLTELQETLKTLKNNLEDSLRVESINQNHR